MASSGKVKSKKKGKTLDLNSFLAEGENGPSGYALANTGMSWADQVDDDHEDTYVSSNKKIYLPTAPKAARGPDVELSKLPTEPPFKAFLANVPYDIDESDVEYFFKNLKVKTVKLPREGGGETGRLKGFAYAEFEDRQSLWEALTLSNETIKGRAIRVDIAGSQDNDRDRGSRNFDRPDRTPDDWRSAPREEPRDFPSRDSYDRGGFGDRYNSRGNDYDRNTRDYNSSRGYNDGYDRNKSDRYGGNRDDYAPSSRYDRGSSDRFDRGSGDRFDRGSGDRFDRGSGDRFDRGSGDRYNRGSGDRFDRGSSDRRDGPNDAYDRGSDRFDRSDRGYGDRSDRGYNDRYGRGGDRYGDDRGFGRRDFGGRDERRFNDRESGSAPATEELKERPRLQLQKRSVPIESRGDNKTSSSIFGGAKPVDTAAKERAIEEKLARTTISNPERREEKSLKEERKPVYNENYASSTDSQKEQEDISDDEKQEKPKVVPAPPPTTNAWARKTNFADELKSNSTKPSGSLNEDTRRHHIEENGTGKSQLDKKVNRVSEDVQRKRDQQYRDDGQKNDRGSFPDKSSRAPPPRKLDEKSHRPEREKSLKDPSNVEDAKQQDFTSANKFNHLLMEDHSLENESE